MSGRDDERIPGFNAPLADGGPIVSKRIGRRRSRVKEVLGAPQKARPGGRPRHERAEALDADFLDELDDGRSRSPMLGLAITLLILFVLGTRGCGLLDSDSDAPTPTPSTPTSTPAPQLVERLTVPTSSTIVERADDTGD